MASSSSQILKYNLSALSVSQPNFPGKSRWFFSEFSSSRKRFLSFRSSCDSSRYYLRKRFSIFCAAQDSDKESNGEEPPESLFMKELRRRGMTPTSLLEDAKSSDYGFDRDEKRKKEGRSFSQTNAVSTEVEKSILNQREQSMKLNSEGLEGLIPRAKLLLTIGGTFFLGFWPLILVTMGFFAALYFYFGPAFVHDASKTLISPPQYIDPYALLEEERISQITPRAN